MRAKLGDVIKPAKVIRRGTSQCPVLSMTMHDGIMLQSDRFKKSLASVDQSDYKVVNYGQLVVGFPIDEGVLYIQRVVPRGIMSPAYNVWDVNYNIIDPLYLELSLHSPQAMQYYKENLRGTTARRRSIPTDTLLALPLPLPSLDEQRQIAAVLDKVSDLMAKRHRQLDKLDELIKSRFIEMFGVYPANPMGWEIGTIRDIVTEVRYGSSRPAVDGGKYPYLRMNNITYGGELDLSDTKRIDIPDNELDKCTVRRGDILFNRTNSKELVGKTCVYDRDEMMVLAGFVIRIRVKDRILPEFLSAFLNTDFSKQMLLGMCKTAIGQANINAQELQNIGLYLPPVELQQCFVQFKKETDKSKLAIQKSLEKLEILKKSLMQKYFG